MEAPCGDQAEPMTPDPRAPGRLDPPAATPPGGPRTPGPGLKRRPDACDWEPAPKQAVSEALAAARLRALGLHHDHGYSGNGLPHGARPPAP